MTIRELAWAVEGRKRDEWERTASVVMGNCKVMTGEPKSLTLSQLFPKWMRDDGRPRRKGPVSDQESEAGMRLLGMALEGQARKRSGR